MKLKTAFVTCAWLAVATICYTPSACGNLVTNGGFETGNFSGWVVNLPTNNTPWNVDPLFAFAGVYYASTGCTGAQCITGTAAQRGSLSQTLTTSAGATYTLTFEFNNQGNSGGSELDVLWNGTSVLDLGPNGTLGPIANYVLYTVTDLPGTGSDTLTFLGRQDTGFNSLDNVDVELSGGTGTVAPEPSTLPILGGILPLIGLIRRKL